MTPDVSVIIVTWNGRQYLEACLESVAAQQGVDTETIVVDNASTDGTAVLVRDRFPWVRLVALDENRGFAGGNNAGARVAQGRHLAFLNNDTVAHPGWLQALRKGIDVESGFVLATSRIVYMHDPDIIDSAGDGFLRWGGAFKRHHGAAAQVASESAEVFGICGAACLVLKTVFDELGGFDEDFFASHEDVDLSYRARLRGYRCRYVADAIVRHHGSATIGNISRFAVLYGQRNLEAAAAYFMRRGLFGTFLRAKLAALGGLPLMIRKRSEVQRTKRVGAAAIRPHLDGGWLATKRREKRFDVGLMESTR